MTAQINDTLLYENETYSLAGISGRGLFDPSEHGLKPVYFSSACWRGFVCEYAVREGRLWLNRLSLGLSYQDSVRARHGRGPTLGGRPITHNDRTRAGDWMFDGVQLELPFSGGLLLATDFMRELYVHMGFHPAWKYRRVIELLFDAGRLTSARDCSEKMAEIRERLARQPLEPSLEDGRREVAAWVEQCFDRDYSR